MGRTRIPTPFASGGSSLIGEVEITNEVGNPIPVSGTITAGAQFAEDSAAADGALGTLALVVRKDTEGANVSANGDYATLLVDANGRLKISIAAAFAEDAASTSGDTGLFVLAIRHDAEGTLVGADGDYGALQLDALGRLRVATGAGYAEDSASVDGDRGLFVLGVRHDADTATVTADGDYSALQTDANGRLKVTTRAFSTAGVPTEADDITVDGTVGGVTLVAADATIKAVTVQNVGPANMRVSVGGTPTATHGAQLTPGASLKLDMPYCPQGTVKAIRETGTSTAAYVLVVR